MKTMSLATLGIVAALFGCGGPSSPKDTISPLPTKPRVTTLRLSAENRIKYQVSLESMVGRGTGAAVSLGPPERLQKKEAQMVSKLVDLNLLRAEAATPEGTPEVYLVHVRVARTGAAFDGPEAYVAIPSRIAENVGAKGGQLRIEDKGVALTIGSTTLYGAWIPPSS